MYKVIRGYMNSNVPSEVLKTGLTLDEARAMCRNPETSSRTCSLPESIALTQKYGPWFAGYDKE